MARAFGNANRSGRRTYRNAGNKNWKATGRDAGGRDAEAITVESELLAYLGRGDRPLLRCQQETATGVWGALRCPEVEDRQGTRRPYSWGCHSGTRAAE